MMIPIDEVVTFDVTTHHPSTGAITDADSGPTYDVFEETTDTPILDDQTLTKRTSLTGNYRGTFTASAANGFEAGKWYSVVASATVNSITAKYVAMSFRVAPAETAAGVPKVDVSHYGGTAGTFASGRPEVNTTHAAGTAWNSGAISASTLAADTITDAKVASDVTIASVTGAVGSVTGAVGSVTGAVGSIASGGITSASFAADAITAGAIATDAIGSAELAASAVTEIQTGLATSSSISTLQTSVDDLPTNAELATALGTADDAVLAQVALVKAKTDNLPSDPADASDIAASFATVNTKLDTIDDFLDTEIAAIKLITDQLTATQAEPSAVPAANASPLTKIAWLAALARNKITQTASVQTLLADNGTTTIATAAVSDDATTFERSEWV